MELASQHDLLEILFHRGQSLTFDTEDAGNDFIMQRFPQFVDRRDRVMEHQQGLEPPLVQGGHGPTKDGVVASGVVELTASVAIACRMIGWPSRIKA